METLDFMQKPIELAHSSQSYLQSLWETATEIQKSYAYITSIFSSMFDVLSNFLVQEAILNMAVYELAFHRLTFLPDYSLSVSTIVQPEEQYFPRETIMPSSPVFDVLLVKKLVADLTRRMVPSRTETMKSEIARETAEEATEEHPPSELTQLPFQAMAEMHEQLESGLTPIMRGLTSTLRAYTSHAVTLSPLTLFFGLGSSATVRRALFIPVIEEEKPRAEHAPPSPLVSLRGPELHGAEEVKPLSSELTTQESPIPEISAPVEQALKLPAVMAHGQAEVRSLPSRLSALIEEVSPSLASWVYGESEALRSTGLSLSAVPVAASAAQRIVTEALVEPISGVEGSERFEPEVPLRLPSVFSTLVATHARNYSPFYAEMAVGEAYALSSHAETPHRGQASRENALPQETGVSRLPSVIALAAAESLIAQRLRHEMTAFAKDVQTAQSTYAESLATTSATGPVRTTKLGELAAAPSFPVRIEPYAPPVSSTPPPQARPRLMDRTIQNTLNLTVSAETQEEDLRELERKISKILAEQLSRYYGSTRI